MFEHADGDNAVKLTVKIAIILQLYLYVQSLTAFLRQLLLLGGNRHAIHGHAVVFCRILSQSAPATADVQQRHTGFQLQLLADHFQLGLLRLLQRVSVFPIAAGILHIGIEHRTEQIVTDIVMLLTHLPGAFTRLTVKQPGIGDARNVAQVFRQTLIDARLQNAGK